MCNCVNIKPQSRECYNQQVVIDIPGHMSEYRENRLKKGLSDKVCIDPCIIEEIKSLWDQSIITYGSCCGHNMVEGSVIVDESCIDKMLELDYVNTSRHHNKDIFKLKSVIPDRPKSIKAIFFTR